MSITLMKVQEKCCELLRQNAEKECQSRYGPGNMVREHSRDIIARLLTEQGVEVAMRKNHLMTGQEIYSYDGDDSDNVRLKLDGSNIFISCGMYRHPAENPWFRHGASLNLPLTMELKRQKMGKWMPPVSVEFNISEDFLSDIDKSLDEAMDMDVCDLFVQMGEWTIAQYIRLMTKQRANELRRLYHFMKPKRVMHFYDVDELVQISRNEFPYIVMWRYDGRMNVMPSTISGDTALLAAAREAESFMGLSKYLGEGAERFVEAKEAFMGLYKMMQEDSEPSFRIARNFAYDIDTIEHIEGILNSIISGELFPKDDNGNIIPVFERNKDLYIEDVMSLEKNPYQAARVPVKKVMDFASKVGSGTYLYVRGENVLRGRFLNISEVKDSLPDGTIIYFDDPQAFITLKNFI